MPTSPADPAVTGRDDRAGRWAPWWVLAYVALWPLPGIAETVLGLGAVYAAVRMIMRRLQRRPPALDIRLGPAGPHERIDGPFDRIRGQHRIASNLEGANVERRGVLSRRRLSHAGERQENGGHGRPHGSLLQLEHLSPDAEQGRQWGDTRREPGRKDLS